MARDFMLPLQKVTRTSAETEWATDNFCLNFPGKKKTQQAIKHFSLFLCLKNTFE